MVFVGNDKKKSFIEFIARGIGCKDALEVPQEILHYDSSLCVWFDREISFEVGGDSSADIVKLRAPECIWMRRNVEVALMYG